MKKTKIMYDRDVIGRFNCTGFKFTKLQKVWFMIKFYTKRTIQVLAVMCTLSWAGYAGYTYALSNIAPKTIYAENRVEVPARVKLSDFPFLMRICQVESGGVQFEKNGNVRRGKVDPSDIGICQINERYNNDQARKLGYDIFTQEGNENMAIWLFVNRGTAPWKASQCIPNGWGTKAECAK